MSGRFSDRIGWLGQIFKTIVLRVTLFRKFIVVGCDFRESYPVVRISAVDLRHVDLTDVAIGRIIVHSMSFRDMGGHEEKLRESHAIQISIFHIHIGHNN